MSTVPRAGRRERLSSAKRRNMFIGIAIGAAALLVAGVAYAEGVLGDDGAQGPVVAGTADFTPVAAYPGWSYAAGTSSSGAPCIVLRTTSGEGRTCAATAEGAGMLNAGFVLDEATGTRFGYVIGFTTPGGQAYATFSDGTSRSVTSTAEGAYFVAVTPDDIDGGVLPVAVAGPAGEQLAANLPREIFEAGS